MVMRLVGSAGVLVALASLTASIGTPVSGQQRATPPSLVVTAFGGAPADYKAPRTPWGDPDLQGVWSSDDMEGIPMSRQQQFGDRLYLNEAEYAARVAQVERGAKQRDTSADST